MFFKNKYPQVFLKVKFCIVILMQTGMLLHTQNASSQTNWQLQQKRELSIAGGLSMWSATNIFLEKKLSLQTINRWKIQGIDKIAVLEYRPKSALISDGSILALAGMAAFWLSKQPAEQRWQKSVVMSQNLWLTWNVTQSTKMAFRRARPYTFSPDFSMKRKDDAYSFISGHSAMAASFVTSMAMMNKGNLGRKNNFLITSAGALALGTAAMRISAGKHFPTDVLAGLLVGTGLSLLNTRLHEK
jgi:hypothetical protein